MSIRRTVGACALLSLLFTGCVAPGSYGRNRLLDFYDAVDLKYGTGIGLGVHLQATKYIEAGLGLSSQSRSFEWFGRRQVDMYDGALAGLVLITFAGNIHSGDVTRASYDILGINLAALMSPGRWTGSKSWFEEGHDLPILDRYRFGGVFYLPGVHVGAFLNVGELCDFFGGVFGSDFMNDDGVPKFAEDVPQAPDA